MRVKVVIEFDIDSGQCIDDVAEVATDMRVQLETLEEKGYGITNVMFDWREV